MKKKRKKRVATAARILLPKAPFFPFLATCDNRTANSDLPDAHRTTTAHGQSSNPGLTQQFFNHRATSLA
jgi:hypothetical protein